MTGYFEQVIFPPKPKPVVVPTVISGPIFISETKARALFETILCGKKGSWISMVECIGCNMSNKTLEELLEDNVGCVGD